MLAKFNWDNMKRSLPIVTITLSLMIVCISSLIAFEVHGSIFSKVRILTLNTYGGVTFNQLANFELWRLFSSHFVHVKPIHMLFNVLSLLAVGYFVEKYLGHLKFTLIFFLAGIAGTLASVTTVPAPYNVGTGASQAVLGICASALVLFLGRIHNSTALKVTLLITITPALALDIIYAGYPKLGHIVGFGVGLVLSFYSLPKSSKPKCFANNSALKEGSSVNK